MNREETTEDIRVNQILAAAGECVARHGYHQTTMDKIAGTAGLSKGAVYWYFKSKEEVLTMLCEYMCREHLNVLNQFTAKNNLPLKEVALGVGKEIFGLLVNESERYKIFFEFWALAGENEQIRGHLSGMKDTWQENIAQLIQAGIDYQELHPEINPREIADAILVLFDGIIVRCIFDKGVNVHKIWETAINAIFDGISDKTNNGKNRKFFI